MRNRSLAITPIGHPLMGIHPFVAMGSSSSDGLSGQAIAFSFNSASYVIQLENSGVNRLHHVHGKFA
jgi:hypothetical protein